MYKVCKEASLSGAMPKQHNVAILIGIDGITGSLLCQQSQVLDRDHAHV